MQETFRQDYLFNDIIDKAHKAFPELKYEDTKPLASEQNVVKVGKQDEHKEHKRNTCFCREGIRFCYALLPSIF